MLNFFESYKNLVRRIDQTVEDINTVKLNQIQDLAKLHGIDAVVGDLSVQGRANVVRLNDHEETINVLSSAVEKLGTLLDSQTELLTKLQEQVVELNAYKEEQEAIPDPKDSDEPWVELIGTSGESDTSGGVQIKLDWNDAFIKHLRSCGYDLPEEDDVVQLWLQAISREIAGDMKGQVENE